MVESLLLSLAGGAAALLVAVWGGALVRALLLPPLPDEVTVLDWRVLAFTAGASMLAGLLAGIAPALRSSRADLANVLRGGDRDVTATRLWLRSVMLAAQVAFTLVLLVGAGLFVRSLGGVNSLDLGLDIEHTLRVEVNTRAANLEGAAANAVYLRLLERARSIPGVEHAAATVGSPFKSQNVVDLAVSGRDSLPGTPFFNGVTAEYFASLGMSIVRGRGLSDADVADSARVTVVGQTFARMVWPGEDPLGKCLYVNDDRAHCVEVVGVVSDARLAELIEEPTLQYYLPLSRVDGEVTDLMVRTRQPAREAQTAVQRALQGSEPDLPYVAVREMENDVSELKRSWRMGATMFSAFGLLALAIAAVGVFGVTSYGVSQRTREIGVRMALGAQPGGVVRLVLVQGVAAAAAGAVAGLPGAWALGRAVRSLLYGVAPTDPLVLGSVTATLLAVALLAAWLPARRAARVDPIVALQSE
jgi:predicted permease